MAEELGMTREESTRGQAERTAEIDAALAEHPSIAGNATVRQALHEFGGSVVSVRPRQQAHNKGEGNAGQCHAPDGPAPSPASTEATPSQPPPPPAKPSPAWTQPPPAKPADVTTEAFDAKVNRRKFGELFGEED